MQSGLIFLATGVSLLILGSPALTCFALLFRNVYREVRKYIKLQKNSYSYNFNDFLLDKIYKYIMLVSGEFPSKPVLPIFSAENEASIFRRAGSSTLYPDR